MVRQLDSDSQFIDGQCMSAGPCASCRPGAAGLDLSLAAAGDGPGEIGVREGRIERWRAEQLVGRWAEPSSSLAG